MSFLKSLLSLYLFFGLVISQFFAAYFFSRDRSNYKVPLFVLTQAVSLYLFAYIMIINNDLLEEMIFWNQIQYIGLSFIPALWLVVALLYTQSVYSIKSKTIALLFVIPLITFFIRLTNSYHHFFYTSFGTSSLLDFTLLRIQRGFWYYINISYTILCLFLTIYIYYREYKNNRPSSPKAKYGIFLSASILPILGVFLVFLVSRNICIDYVALIMPLSLITILYGIFN